MALPRPPRPGDHLKVAVTYLAADPHGDVVERTETPWVRLEEVRPGGWWGGTLANVLHVPGPLGLGSRVWLREGQAIGFEPGPEPSAQRGRGDRLGGAAAPLPARGLSAEARGGGPARRGRCRAATCRKARPGRRTSGPCPSMRAQSSAQPPPEEPDMKPSAVAALCLALAAPAVACGQAAHPPAHRRPATTTAPRPPRRRPPPSRRRT